MVCRRFGLSTFWFVDVSACRRFGLSTFRFVDVLVCRRFGLSTFRLVDISVGRRFDQLSLQVPSCPLFVIIASTLVCKKRQSRHLRDLNVLFSLNRCYLQYIVCGIDATYPHTTRGPAADSMALTILQFTQTLTSRRSHPLPFWRGILQVPSYALPPCNATSGWLFWLMS